MYRKLVYRAGAPMRATLRASLAAVAVTFVALTSLAAPMAAGAVVGAEVPFKGSLAGVEINDGGFPVVSIQGEGTGNSTQLGRFTYDNPHTVNLLTRHGCGTWTFTAANGDTLTSAGCGDATVVSGTPPFAVLSIAEDYEITGGTGRFAAATGSYHVERLFDQATSVTTGSFEGTISSTGETKH
jgi:hypothetical protein